LYLQQSDRELTDAVVELFNRQNRADMRIYQEAMQLWDDMRHLFIAAEASDDTLAPLVTTSRCRPRQEHNGTRVY
jgi:hypothetical protein